jgi:hypothetical protein
LTARTPPVEIQLQVEDSSRQFEALLSSAVRYSAFDSASFLPRKPTCDVTSDGGTALNLASCPHAKLQDVLELFG